MRITFVYISLFLFASINVFGQPFKIDSLLHIIAKAKPDSNKVNTLNDIGQTYGEFKPDSSYYYHTQALLLSKKINFIEGEAKSLLNIGYIAMQKSDYPTALDLNFRALNLTNKKSDLSILVYIRIGLVYFYIDDFEDAKYNLLRAYTLVQYATQNNNNNTDIERFYSHTLTNLGRVYLKQNKLDSALYYEQLAYETAIRLNYKSYLGLIYSVLGEIHIKLGNENIGKEFLKNGVTESINQNNIRSLMATYISIAKFFRNKSLLDSSVIYAMKGLGIAQKNSYLLQVSDIATLLSDIYHIKGKDDSAFHYLQMSTVANKNIFSQEKQSRLQVLILNENLKEIEEKERSVKDKERYNRNLQCMFIGISLICFITIFLLISRSIIVTERTIRSLGIVGLLVTFEFIYLLIDPYISQITHYGPVVRLFVMVCIASIISPIHHRLEKWINNKLVKKNKQIRLQIAHKIITELKDETMNEQL